MGPSERYRVHREIRRLLAVLARRQPLVLAIDDVHWADDATLETLAHLVRKPPDADVFLALVHRGAPPAALAQPVRAASVGGRLRAIELGPLTADQAAPLLEVESDPARRAAVFEQSGGNPFFLEQLLATPRRSPEATPRDAAIPPAVTARLSEVLDELEPPGRALLEGAAVAGEPFEVELAAEVGEVDHELALAHLDALLDHDLIRQGATPRRFRFRHPIIREAVYESMPAGRRLSAHGRAAAALAAAGASPEARAHHVALTAKRGDGDAIELLTRAASTAGAAAPGSAALWLSAALDLVPEHDVAQRLGVLAALAQLQAASGQLAAAHESLLGVAGQMEGVASARLTGALAVVEQLLGRNAQARARLEAALAASDQGPEVAVELMIALAVDGALSGDFDRCVDWAGRASERSSELADATIPVAASALAAFGAVQLGRVVEAEAARSAAAAGFDRLGDGELGSRVETAWYLAIAERFLGYGAVAVGRLRRAIELALAAGNAQYIVAFRAWLGYSCTSAGLLEEALEQSEAAVDTGRLLGGGEPLRWALWTRAVTLSAVGEFDPAIEAGAEAFASAQADGAVVLHAHAIHGVVCSQAGEHERALSHIGGAGAPEFTALDSLTATECCEAATRSALALGRVDEAARWCGRAEELAAMQATPLTTAAAARARALLHLAEGAPDQAARSAVAAIEAATERDVPLARIAGEVLAGRALAACDEVEGARGYLTAALRGAERIGAHPLAAAAAHELRGLGDRVPAPVARRAGAGVELSSRERQIANLVTAGRTNREIAERLHLSVKTVENHMSRIFRKLEVGSRAEVAAAIARGA
jgi:DNA-binding CsgD family transcriptional regulator